MGKIQELPKLDRPREKAQRYGVETLSDSELLAMIIGSGYHGENAEEVANNLLSTYNGLSTLSNANFAELIKHKGIKENRACNLLAAFEIHRRLVQKSYESEENIDSQYLYDKYSSRLINEKQEVLVLIIVNRRRQITYEKTLYKGTESQIIYSYKDIWRELLAHDASAFYLIHNHPHQMAIPSRNDIVFTSEIFTESKRIKIPLIDHLIIGDDGYYSFEKMRKINISC